MLDMINPRCAQTMANGIGCKLRNYAGGGHVIPWQCPEDFNHDLASLTTSADAFWEVNPDQ